MLVSIATNDTRGSVRQFATDKAGGARKFVGYGVDGCVQRVAVGIATSAIVDERSHPGHANRNFGQTFSPRTSETVADDDGHVDLEMLLDLLPESRRRSVRILRQQYCVPASIDVRHIDAAVGADKSVFGFADHHAVLSPNDASALAHRQLTDPRVEAVAFCPNSRCF